MEKAVERGRLEVVAAKLLGVSRQLNGLAKDKVYLAACWVQSSQLPCPYQDYSQFVLPNPSDGDVMDVLHEALVEINTTVVPVDRHPLLEQAIVNIQEAVYLLGRSAQ